MPYKERTIQKHSWTIGDIAIELRVETHTVRFWCKEFGLRVPRNERGHRKFHERQRRTIHLIHSLTRFGYSLDRVRWFISKEDQIRKDIHSAIITQRDDVATDQIMKMFGFLMEKDAL